MLLLDQIIYIHYTLFLSELRRQSRWWKPVAQYRLRLVACVLIGELQLARSCELSAVKTAR